MNNYELLSLYWIDIWGQMKNCYSAAALMQH